MRACAFDVADSNTAAGIRQVSIHAEPVPALKHLKQAATGDGHVLPGSTFDRCDDQPKAVGRRFGRQRTALGSDDPRRGPVQAAAGGPREGQEGVHALQEQARGPAAECQGSAV
jgi:hypothetical protein